MTASRSATGVPPPVAAALVANADILLAAALEAMPERLRRDVSSACDEGGHLCVRVVLSHPPRIEAAVIDRPGKRLDLGAVVPDTDAGTPS